MRKSKKAFICELIMSPNEEQIPKAINKRDAKGISVPTELEDMYPFLSKKELVDMPLSWSSFFKLEFLIALPSSNASLYRS